MLKQKSKPIILCINGGGDAPYRRTVEWFKFQRPITGSDENSMNQMLVYNEDRRVEMFIDLRTTPIRWPEGCYKFYIKGFVNQRGVFIPVCKRKLNVTESPVF